MAIPNEKIQKYNYSDYLNWAEGERWELIHGQPYSMSPAPSTEHQIVLGELFYQFRNYLKNKECQVFVAPFDVRLPSNGEEDDSVSSVVQPDISVVCDKSKIDSRGCKGAPDLIIEIVSPGTFRKDVKEKFYLYEENGVKEYWLVYPNEKTIMIYKLEENNRYGRPQVYSDEEILQVGIFKGMTIDCKDIFMI